MPDGSDPNIITEAEAAAQSGRLDEALVMLIKARAWLKQDSNIQSLPADERPMALVLKMQIGNAILELKNRQLEELIGESKEDLALIEEATREINETIGKIAEATRFIKAVSQVVSLVLKLF